jgi:hypothetical protein
MNETPQAKESGYLSGIMLGLAAVLILLVGVAFAFSRSGTPAPAKEESPAAVSSIATPDLSFSYSGDWGLATNPTQVTAKAYIPPCDPDFDYCLYYVGDAYAGTNFESAGLRVKRRADLAETGCLAAVPEGYAGLKPVTQDAGEGYSTAVFSPLGDAGAGHYASGELYRLSWDKSCYEFETRIGETQFANYPAGTVNEFTAADRTALRAMLRAVVDSVTTKDSSAPVKFPAAAH